MTCARSKELLDRRMNGDGFYASFLFDDCFSVLHQQNKHQSLRIPNLKALYIGTLLVMRVGPLLLTVEPVSRLGTLAIRQI